ncbi:hypothetical protein L9F63_000582, partial [Diploptera punctata]
MVTLKGSLIIMDCQLDIKKEVHEFEEEEEEEFEIGSKNMEMMIKNEYDDQFSRIDIKCETYPDVDTLSSEDPGLE